jgi:predicted ATPase
VRLVGRERECALIDTVLADVRAGRSRALVLRGTAGSGKTTLLRYAAHLTKIYSKLEINSRTQLA